MTPRELIEKWEREAKELRKESEKDKNINTVLDKKLVADIKESHAAELRAALPEKPLSRKWREEEKAVRGSNEESDTVYAIAESADYYSGVSDTLNKCASDLDAQHDEGRALLRRMVEAVDNFNNTRPEKMVDHVWALGSLLKVTNEASNHLGGDSDEA